MKFVNFGSKRVGTDAQVKYYVPYVENQWYKARIEDAEYKESRVSGRHLLKVSFMLYKGERLILTYLVAPMDTDRLGIASHMLKKKKEFCNALDLNIPSDVWDGPYGPDVNDIIGREMYIKVQCDKQRIYRDHIEAVHFKSCAEEETRYFWRPSYGV